MLPFTRIDHSSTSAATIHGNFEVQASLTPSRIALKFGEVELSYQDLNNRANALAHRLRHLGVGPEIPVALYLDRSIEMVVAILAVLKAGGAYVPIDLAYPIERMQFMLEETAAPVVLTQSNLLSKLPAGNREVLCIDEPREIIGPFTDPESGAKAENAAYIMYTSGSTGKPKGVIVTHRNVVRLLRSTEHWFRFNEDDVWPLFHSYAFDMSVWELWGALFYGGRLVIVPRAIARSPEKFYSLLSREKVTFINQTPSAFRQLIWADTTAAEKLPLCLRHVTLGGEALELQSLRPWFERHGDKAPVVVNMYGITETTVHTTYRPITWEDLRQNAASLIGVPIPDLQVHLLDEHLKPVPQGEPGEICVGGSGVARGYLNRPELTSQRFIPDLFVQQPGATLYRSGDLARINAVGEMEYLGRMDHQVKIRGFRVELGEIESALNRHPAVRESAVIALQSGSDKRLVAYFVSNTNSPATAELRAHLATMLPDYMVPACFVSLPAFPLNNNGKIDRRALPAPEAARPELPTPYSDPEGEKEKLLEPVWQEVLGVHPIGRNDNFFELGGDSIRAIVLLSKARESGLHFPLESLFANPTIAGLAAVCLDQGSLESRTSAPFDLISRTDRDHLPAGAHDAYPITALQLGMFFHNELDPLSAMYHDVFSYKVQAAFDPERLEEVIQGATARHPMLRTSFHLSKYSRPLQVVHSEVRMPFTWEDLRTQTPAEQQQQILGWINAEKRRPFNRSIAPLMRFHVQLQSEGQFQLFISFHHCCTDGWSLAVLITEILQDYHALLSGKPMERTAPESAYRDFVALELAAAKSPESIHFWTDHLNDASPKFLPRWPKSMRCEAHEQERGPEIQIPAEILSGLKQAAQKAGTPLKTVLLAAHQRVMATLYGQEDVITGLVSNGRPEQADGDRLIGLFLNTIPIRQKLVSGSWLDLIQQTFEVERAVMPHRRFPLVEVRKLRGHPLMETAFDFVHFHVLNNLHTCDGLGFAEGPYFEANNLTTYTTFMLDATSSRLELHIDYDPRAITREQIDLIDGYYMRALEAIATNPEQDCLNLPSLSEAEIFQQTQAWNETQQDYPASETIHALFEAQAKAHPDLIAVACGAETLTYSQLNAESDRLAAMLTALGISTENLVGICLDRSPRMLVALLATLKAGAAYVPLDPAFPAERLRFMIEDSGLQAILTEEKVESSLPETAAQVVRIDREWAPPEQTSAAKQFLGLRSPLAYVIYTSGSTGKPKGVQIEHRSVINLLLSAAKTLNFRQSDNLLATTTLSFDIAALELLMPLITGAKVTIAERGTAADGTAMIQMMEDSKATFMQATPSTWRLLLEAGWKGIQTLTIISGGEALPASLASELKSRCAALWNFYGPTETTIWSTAWKVDTADSISIGRPLANTRAYVLNSRMQPVPIGTPGELWLGGDGLARGYLNRPELNQERFLPDPFSMRDGDRVYRTGDLARYLPDGRLECLGRIDHQVKIRGHRIELGEIETALRQFHGIANAVVTARPDRHGENRLAAYLVSSNGEIGIKLVRDFLAVRLPHYMIPAHFIVLKDLPLTPNGKINMQKLPAPELSATSTAPFVNPEGEVQKTLAGIWQDVLDVPRIGADDNIFDLGADSLSATRAFARINSMLGTRIGLREILEHPTIRLQANVAQANRNTTFQPAIKVQPRRKALQTFRS